MERMIYSSLQEIVREIIKLCDEWRNKGEIRKEIRFYQRYRVEKFEYKKKKKGTQESGSFQIIPKEEWSISDISRLLQYIENLPSFKNTVKYIADEYASQYPNPEAQANLWVSVFIQRIIVDYLNGKFDLGRNLDEYIVIFIHDLKRAPVEWNIKVWLEGVWMEVDEIEIEKGVIIRKPRPNDIEYERPLGMPLPEPMFQHPSAVLEIRKRMNKQSIHTELERIIVALQLYKLGSIYEIHIYWMSKSFLQWRLISTPMHRWQATYRYSLEERDVEKLPQFMMKIKAKLPIDERTGHIKTTTPIGMAILRYQDTILKPEVLENKIAYAIMGLEALYLKPEERGELSRRLAQRVAKLLSYLGEKPIRAYEIVREAYKIRSSFVHGSPHHSKSPKKIKEILDNVLEYLRKSIILFLHLEKNKIIPLIDDALLEKDADAQLQAMIKDIIDELSSAS